MRIIVDFIPEDRPKYEEPRNVTSALFDLYKWLDRKGILKRIAFKYEVIDGQVQFAFDSSDLLPYEAKILHSLPECREAVERILRERWTPCMYCGGISLIIPMFSYRSNVDDSDIGTVERSWECCRCQLRKHYKVSEIFDYSIAHSPKSTIAKYWKDFGE